MSIFGTRDRGESAGQPPRHGEPSVPPQPATSPVVPPAGTSPVSAQQMPLDPDYPAPVTAERLQAWMRDNNYSFFIDSDGDLGGIWDNRIFHFLILGDGSAFQVRGQWNRFGNMDQLENLLDAVNVWNSDRIWPKAYVRVRDDGSIVTCTDLTIPLDAGVTEPQLDLQLRCGLATSAAFFDSLESQFPDSLARRS